MHMIQLNQQCLKINSCNNKTNSCIMTIMLACVNKISLTQFNKQNHYYPLIMYMMKRASMHSLQIWHCDCVAHYFIYKCCTQTTLISHLNEFMCCFTKVSYCTNRSTINNHRNLGKLIVARMLTDTNMFTVAIMQRRVMLFCRTNKII